MSIQYNTNSKLISRFQKKLPLASNNNNSIKNSTTTSKNPPDGSPRSHQGNDIDQNSYNSFVSLKISSSSKIPNNNIHVKNSVDTIDTPFHSSFVKNSPEYLMELCDWIYPESMHDQIANFAKIDDGTLELYAFCALILENFIKHWYGVKIPTENNEFIIIILDLLQDVTNFIKLAKWDQERFFLDSLPILISQHIQIIKRLRLTHNEIKYHDMCQQYLISTDHYPNIITNLINDSLQERSVLQDSFIEALMNKLLLGRVLDSCIEPYYILRGIEKLCDKLLHKKIRYKAERKSFAFSGQITNNIIKLYSYGKDMIFAIRKDPTSISSTQQRQKNSILNRYLFTLIGEDIFKLHVRKPIIYTVLRYVQHYLNNSKTITTYLSKRFAFLISEKAFNVKNRKYLFNNLRQLLFPNDNLMGPRTAIPTGEKFDRYKFKVADKLWFIIQLNRLDSLAGVSHSDVSYFIETICTAEKGCNKLLLFRVLDCYLQTLRENNDVTGS